MWRDDDMVVKSWLRGTALVLVAAVVACDDGAAPDVDFNPQAAAEAMESMVAATEGLEDAMGSMAAAAPLLEGGTAASLMPDGRRLYPQAAALQELAAASALGFFPANYLGVTFVWNEGEAQYAASQLAGAPEDGIRIIYYAVDPVTHEPASPLNPLGHVDLRDLSTAASDRLGVVIVRDGATPTTLADYYIDLAYGVTETETSVDVSSVGFLSNGTDQLNFDLGQGLVLSESQIVLTMDYAVDLEGTDIGVNYEATLAADAATESASLVSRATITNGPETVTMEMSFDGESYDGVVLYQGVEVAYIGGTSAQPTFTDGNGDPLSEEDLQALADLWEAVGTLFAFVEGVFGVAA
jgi:hypothetical protein